MRLQPPFVLSSIGQRFGQNLDGAYAAQGLLGHPGIDFGDISYWGRPIPCAIDGSIVSAILSQYNPNLEAYRAVNSIVEADGQFYEIQYGHISTTDVKVGDILREGQTVAYVGNTGDVYVGTPAALVSDAQKQAGNHAGAHVHFQVRLIGREPATGPTDPHKVYLNDGSGELIVGGYRYYQINPLNGYNSCIDPMPLFEADDLSQTIKQEITVLKNQDDPVIRQSLTQLLIAQAKKLLGITN